MLCDGRKGDGREHDVDDSDEHGDSAGDFLLPPPLHRDLLVLRPPEAPDLWVFM